MLLSDNTIYSIKDPATKHITTLILLKIVFKSFMKNYTHVDNDSKTEDCLKSVNLQYNTDNRNIIQRAVSTSEDYTRNHFYLNALHDEEAL